MPQDNYTTITSTKKTLINQLLFFVIQTYNKHIQAFIRWQKKTLYFDWFEMIFSKGLTKYPVGHKPNKEIWELAKCQLIATLLVHSLHSPVLNYRVLYAKKPDTAGVQCCFGRLFKRCNNNNKLTTKNSKGNKNNKCNKNNKGAGGAIKQTCVYLCGFSAWVYVFVHVCGCVCVCCGNLGKLFCTLLKSWRAK